jgi:hypothetical protein
MDLTDLRAFEADTAAVVPGFKLDWKNTSSFHKLLGLIMKPFNPGYMTSYTTTFYPKVWFPTQESYEKDPGRSLITLAHERVHLLDTKASPLWFRLSYALPQALLIPFLITGTVLAFFFGWWSLIAFGLGLACLAPWPSSGRVRLEQRGYAMSMAVLFWLTGDIPFERKDSIRKQFLSMAYYKMAWSPGAIDKWLEATDRSIRNGTLAAGDEVYGSVLRFLQSRGKAKL